MMAVFEETIYHEVGRRRKCRRRAIPIIRRWLASMSTALQAQEGGRGTAAASEASLEAASQTQAAAPGIPAVEARDSRAVGVAAETRGVGVAAVGRRSEAASLVVVPASAGPEAAQGAEQAHAPDAGSGDEEVGQRGPQIGSLPSIQ